MVRTLASIALAALVAVPAANAAEPRNDPRSAATARAIGGAVSPYARVSLLYDYQYGVVRSKGVTSMRRVRPGHYCIKPSTLTSTDVQRAVPVVSPDFSGSSGLVLFAYARTLSSLCTSGEFAVQTVRGDSGSFATSNAVGFSFIVP